MNTEIKAKWIAKLRSGDYSQARGYLRTKDGFCCLGVLCDVLDPHKWKIVKDCIGEAYMHPRRLSGGLTPLTQDEVGISRIEQSKLIQLNDGYQDATGNNVPSQPFSKIADWIEANL